MPEFLELLRPNDAINIFKNNLIDFRLKTEVIKTENSQYRVLAKDVISHEDIPSFSRSTVDGFAVRSKDTYGSSDVMPAFFDVIGEIRMGKPADLEIKQGQTCLIHTGGMLPNGADAIVMIENTQYSNEHEIEVYKAVPPGENVILKGEDIKKGGHVLSAGTKLRSSEIGALMALGIVEIEVYKTPTVGIISTGDEVVPPDTKPTPGQVRDINSYILRSIVEKFSGKAKNYPIVKDDKKSLVETLQKAHLENDLVIVTAGSSASVRDLTSEAINEIGSPGVLVHGINVRPGKPTILAVVNGKPIIGLPGNPVSAFVIAHLILGAVMPFIQGEEKQNAYQTTEALLTINISSAAGREDWIPVKHLGKNKDGIALVEPIFYKSNLIFSLLSAYGFAKIDPDVTGLDANSKVEVIII